MLKKQYFLIFILSIITFTFFSCSKYQKLLKSSDYNLKYEKAIEYFEDEDYYRSLSLLEEILSVYRGTSKAEKISYYYAYCHYHQKEYILAGYHFQNFATTFPNSEYTEECEFQSAYCYFLNSYKPSLDQSITYKAIETFQLFINKYPDSERINKSNELIDKLRYKLETKSFNNAKLYLNLGDYKAATISLKSSLIEFPDTPYREELLYLILKSEFLFASSALSK